VLGNAYRQSVQQWDANLLHMVLRAKGKFVNRPTHTGGKKYDKFYIYLPTDLVNDSQFPFKEGDEIEMAVDVKSRKLVIELA